MLHTWHCELWLAAVGVQPGNLGADVEQRIQQQAAKRRLSRALAAADGCCGVASEPHACLVHGCADAGSRLQCANVALESEMLMQEQPTSKG